MTGGMRALDDGGGGCGGGGRRAAVDSPQQPSRSESIPMCFGVGVLGALVCGGGGPGTEKDFSGWLGRSGKLLQLSGVPQVLPPPPMPLPLLPPAP